MPDIKFRVAICGGGVGGLVCAIALSQYSNIAVDVYEKEPSFEDIGAGLTIWPRPWKILKKFGLEDDLLKQTHVQPRDQPSIVMQYRCIDQNKIIHSYDIVGDGPFLSFYRSDLQCVLLKHLSDACNLHCSKALESYTQTTDGPVELLFRDGASSTCDLLVGSDGLRSAVRRRMLIELAAEYSLHVPLTSQVASTQSCIEPRWTGSTVYRSVIPAELIRAKAPNHSVLRHPIQYIGKNAHAIAYMISRGTMINLGVFDIKYELEGTQCPVRRQAGAELLKALKEDWEPEMVTLIDCVDQAMAWPVHVVKPLPTFVHGRVVLLGDSAHAMSPFQGSGAGQAIEDAYILSELLGHSAATVETIPRALEIYNLVRRPFAQDIVQRSDRQGQMYFDVKADEISGEQAKDKLDMIGGQLKANLEWVWLSTAEEMREEAVQMLEESGT